MSRGGRLSEGCRYVVASCGFYLRLHLPDCARTHLDVKALCLVRVCSGAQCKQVKVYRYAIELFPKTEHTRTQFASSAGGAGPSSLGNLLSPNLTSGADTFGTLCASS